MAIFFKIFIYKKVLIFRYNVWSAAMKLPGPRAFWPVIMAAVAVGITPFFAAIIAMRQAIGTSSPVDLLDGSDGSFDSSDGYAEL